MKDSLGNIIYVGKSKNLKSRVGSYFQNLKSHSPKVIKLIKNLKDFEYRLTDTEFEAFILECNLIKEIKPTYNRLMKTPMSYAYIKVKIHEEYPDIEISNEYIENDGNIYFGPYTNSKALERGLQGIRECCKILCNNFSRKTSSCLNYSLGLCIGICLDNISREQYIDIFNKILSLLNGTDKSILNEMERKMNSAAEKFDFKTAAKYRDYITSVNYILDKLNVVEFSNENKNIVMLESLDNNIFKLFIIKGNKIIFSEKYNLREVSLEELKAIFKSNIKHYFSNISVNSSFAIGKEDLDEAQIIYSYLKSNSSNCTHTIIPEKWLHAETNLDINKVDKLLTHLLNKFIKLKLS